MAKLEIIEILKDIKGLKYWGLFMYHRGVAKVSEIRTIGVYYNKIR